MNDPRLFERRSADVTWFQRALDPASRSQKKHFANLAATVSFTMERLPVEYRSAARILVDGPSIHIEEIEKLYAQLQVDDED